MTGDKIDKIDRDDTIDRIDRVERIGDVPVLLCAADGPVIGDAAAAVDVIGAAFGLGARWAAVPVGRLSEDFFRLRTGVAGEVTQKFAQYGVGLAVVGDITAHVAVSDPLRDLIREAERGRSLLFAGDLDELGRHLAKSAGRNGAV